MHDPDLVARAGGFHPWDAMALALLDGPHAYPLPQIEFAYLFPRLRAGGWLVVDDVQIRAGMNRHTILRYSWRDWLRRLLRGRA